MLTAHARNAYQGERKIYVAMGDMLSLYDSQELNPLEGDELD
jgi:hypothetical protein